MFKNQVAIHLSTILPEKREEKTRREGKREKTRERDTHRER